MLLSLSWSEETHRPEKLHNIESRHKPTLGLVALLNSEEHDGACNVGDGEADHAEACLVGLLYEPAVETESTIIPTEARTKGSNIPNEEEADDTHDANGNT